MTTAVDSWLWVKGEVDMGLLKRLLTVFEPPNQVTRAEQRLTLTNHHADPRKVIVEPWASEFVVAPGDSLTVVIGGPIGGSMEAQEVQQGWVVFGWIGSTYSVIDSRGKTIDSTDSAVPAVPTGVSVRSFVTTMFKPGSE